MIDEMSCLKMEETHLITYRNSLTNRDFRQILKILQIYIDRDLAWADAKLLACQEKKAKLQKTMEDYINKSFDVRFIEQCIEYGCGGGMGWDQIIKDAYREKEEEQKRLAQETADELIEESPLEKYENRQKKIMNGTITDQEIAEYLKEIEPYIEYGRQLTLQERQKEQAFAQEEAAADEEAHDFENQTGIFDFQPNNDIEEGYVGCLPSTNVFDPY